MSAIRVGVVGVGHLGSAHARNYNEIPGVELVGIHDSILSRARKRARECDCKCFHNLVDLLNEVQAVSIVVPTEYHYDICMKSLENGIHVLVEKPITRNLEEADELIRIAARKGLILQVGHIERFNPVVERGNKVVENPLFIECHRLSPFRPRGTDVDVILDLMIHDIDLALKFVDSEVDTIDAVGIPVITDKIDIANARISFRNHAVANITASRISKEVVRKMRIFQRDAYISMDFHKKALEIIRLNTEPGHDWSSTAGTDGFFVSDRSMLSGEEPLRRELSSFVESVRTGKNPVASGKDGRNALHVAVRILDEIKGTPIRM
ncbi:MAG: Gfo/Idh/MocA family oxidoreductase [Candidatus Glassbacteria bacterium]